MKNSWVLFILCIVTFGCQSDKKSASDIINHIPESASIIIRTNSVESFKSSVKTNSLLQELVNYSQIQELNTKLEPFTLLKTENDCFITLSRDVNDSLEISFITYNSPSVFSLDSVSNIITETFTTKDKAISKHEINNSTFYSAVSDSILHISNRLKSIESVPRNNTGSSELKNLLKISNPEKSVSIVVDMKKHVFNLSNTDHSELNESQFSNYLLLDGDISQNDIKLNGVTKAIDSSKSLISVFKGNIPQENKLSKVAPFDSDYFFSLTFSDFNSFNTQLSEFKAKDVITENLDAFETIIEVGYLKKENNKAIIFQSLDASSTQEEFSQDKHTTFRSVDIYNWDKSVAIDSIFSPFIPEFNTSHYVNIDDFFILTEDLDFLESIISTFQNNQTLSETPQFQDMMMHLSDESSLLVYANNSELNTILNENFKEEKTLNLKPYKASAIQFIYDTDFAHVNSVFRTHKSRAKNKSVTEDLNIAIDASILINPQLVHNHTNNQKDIVIQDVNNNLYLISNQGKIYWKKKIDGKILGDIQQIDMYKNGRLQLAFATSNKVYVLDRNGKNVSPFPLNFNDNITQPLSVFDYDKKRNYRLLVTQGKNVLMYDQRGKIVSGFTYKSAQNNISTQPKHFRISRKDYLVFADGNTMEILDRVGKRRVQVKESIDFSENEIYLYKNKFTTTNSRGELLEVNQKGNVNHTNLNLSESHAIQTTSKTLVALSDNKLRIKSNTINLEFGDYTNPKIFYINDKIYVTVTDLQSKKVYLFDSQAKPIQNFPVYGNSAIEMADIDNDNTLEIVVKGDDQSLIIYEIN